MVDKTPQVGGGAPLSGQQFSTKGEKLADLKNQNKLLFDYFKKAGLNENSYVYSNDIKKIKEAYDKNDNGKLSKKEARAIFGEDVSRRDIKKAIKALDVIAATDLEGDGQYPVKVSDNETHYYAKDNTLVASVLQDNETRTVTSYGPEQKIKEQIVQNKNSDGSLNFSSHLLNEYNKDGTIYSRQERLFGENEEFTEITTTFLNGDESKPVSIEHNINGNKKTTNIEYNTDGKKIRSIETGGGQKAEVVYDEFERPIKRFDTVIASDAMTIHEYKYNGTKTTPAEILTTNPDGTKENVTYDNGKPVYREEIVELSAEDLKNEEKPEVNKKSSSQKVHVPDDWGSVPASFRHSSGITDAKDAEGALKTLLDTRGIKETDVDKDKLLADLVKYNPSLFDKDGKVKNNAKWDRLDLPNNIAEQYKNKTEDTVPHVFIDSNGNPKVKVTKITPENVREVLDEFNEATSNNKSLPSAIIFDNEISDEDKLRALNIIKENIDESNNNRNWVKPSAYRYTVPDGTPDQKFKGASMYEYVFGKGSSGMLNIPDKYKFDPGAEKRMQELEEKFGGKQLPPFTSLEVNEEPVQVPLKTDRMVKEEAVKEARAKAEALAKEAEQMPEEEIQVPLMTEKMKKEAEAEQAKKQAQEAANKLNESIIRTPWQTE